MTCKDCMGYQFCKDFLDRTEFDNDFVCYEVEKQCINFKNKDLFVELPCKINDTVYIISDNIIYECKLKNQLMYQAINYNLEIGRKFDGLCKGIQTVFPTKNQAEIGLKEFKENVNRNK